jgi:hypothetical protein
MYVQISAICVLEPERILFANNFSKITSMHPVLEAVILYVSIYFS